MIQSSETEELAKTPKFSVIIPCWNAEKTLAQTLESLISQTYENWHAIIIDDGSLDKTPEIISQYCSKDCRFSTITTSRNGPSNARNLAATDYAQGEY